MKIQVDKKFLGSGCGLLRLGTVGLGGAIFGTMAQNNLARDPTGHFLMWVSVFAWIFSTIILLTGMFSQQLFSGGSEYRVNFVFSVLYLLSAILYGVYNINRVTTLAILVFVYAAINFLLYLILSMIQLMGSDTGKKMKEDLKAKKASKKTKQDEKKDLKDEEQNIDEAVAENPKEELSQEPAQMEEKAQIEQTEKKVEEE